MKTITDIKSGAHLGVVRKFIQRKCVNGDRVMWGSTESVGELTVADLELLAQDIRNAVVKEIDQTFALPHTVIELKIARIEKFLQGLDGVDTSLPMWDCSLMRKYSQKAKEELEGF